MILKFQEVILNRSRDPIRIIELEEGEGEEGIIIC
jgi:hypothetical protein